MYIKWTVLAEVCALRMFLDTETVLLMVSS